MRPLLAVLLTTVPTAVTGRRWVHGSEPFRTALGSLIGIAALAWGAIVGGLLGFVVPGAAAGLAAAWVAGPAVRRRSALRAERRGTAVIAAALVVLVVGGVLTTLAFWRPVPRWDAWAIWSLKAKAIASLDGFDNAVFTSPAYAYSHQDYPPLLSAWQAVAYRISGDLRVSYPTQVQLAWLWTAGALAILGLVARWRAPPRLILLAWAVAPQVIHQALTGYADVPMALFLVAGAAAFADAIDGEDAGGRAGILPAAVLLAAASLTKEEGALFAGAFLVPFVVIARTRRRALVTGAVVAAALAPWFAFTRANGLVSDFIRQRPGAPGVAGPVSPLGRLPQVLSSIGGQIVRLGGWALLIPACAVAVLWLRGRIGPLVVAAGAAFAALTAVYLVSPYDITWHLSRSVDRTVVAPLGLLALAASRAGTPRAVSEEGGARLGLEPTTRTARRSPAPGRQPPS